MGTSRQDIERWFDQGVALEATHMIIVCDTFDHEDFPIFVENGEDFYERYDRYDGKNMQKIMEVYDLARDKNEQLSAHRARRLAQRRSEST